MSDAATFYQAEEGSSTEKVFWSQYAEAGHPVPDQAGIDATRDALAIAAEAGPERDEQDRHGRLATRKPARASASPPTTLTTT